MPTGSPMIEGGNGKRTLKRMRSGGNFDARVL